MKTVFPLLAGVLLLAGAAVLYFLRSSGKDVPPGKGHGRAKDGIVLPAREQRRAPTTRESNRKDEIVPNRDADLLGRLLDAVCRGDRIEIRALLDRLLAELFSESVPLDQNAAPLLMKAFARFVGPTVEEGIAFDKAVGGGTLTEEEREALRAYLAKHKEALALLQEALERPHCRFDIAYEDGFSALLPHMGALIRAGRLLQIQSSLGEGGPPEVLTPLQRMADALHNEPTLVSQLVRVVLQEDSLKWLEVSLSQSMSDEGLRGWIDRLDGPSFRAALKKAVLFELYAGMSAFLQPERALQEMGFPPNGPPWHEDLVHFTTALLDSYRMVGEPYHRVSKDLASWESANEALEKQSLNTLLPAIHRAALSIAKVEAKTGAAKIGTAVRLYQNLYGRLPQTLQEVRVVLPELPLDPFTGKDFRYRLDEKGFAVYSLGEDEEDGGGSEETDVAVRGRH